MNGFFLFNYLGRPGANRPNGSGNFIVNELNFSPTQLQQFNSLEAKHHNAIRVIGDSIKILKVKLFNSITSDSINQEQIDNITQAIADNIITKETELFNRLRGIYLLCDARQQLQFKTIIKKSRRFDNKGREGRRRPE
tara:strand:+ start:4861 stop:5274 length:414 start_codon:yes stop_codon:yes gene_type:complete